MTSAIIRWLSLVMVKREEEGKEMERRICLLCRSVDVLKTWAKYENSLFGKATGAAVPIQTQIFAFTHQQILLLTTYRQGVDNFVIIE